MGAIFFATVILFAAVLTRKYALACFLVLSTLVLPLLALENSLLYRLPLPLCFMRATGFLYGDEIATDSITGENTLLFKHLSNMESFAACQQRSTGPH